MVDCVSSQTHTVMANYFSPSILGTLNPPSPLNCGMTCRTTPVTFPYLTLTFRSVTIHID